MTTLTKAITRTSGVKIPGIISPVPMVFAIAVVNTKGPAKLHTAARINAYNGLRARVATIVAIELPASFTPFIKQKSNARKIPKINMNSIIYL